MQFSDTSEFASRWQLVLFRFKEQFGEEPDLQTILFLIGVQELGQGYRKFSKDEKQDLIHIATCRLLSRYGYYELSGQDKDGWPHWDKVGQVPYMTLMQQEQLLKHAVVDYLEENKILNSGE